MGKVSFERRTPNIIVCGGAGYIGSHAVAELIKANHQVVVFDNFETGHEESLIEGVSLIKGDLREIDMVREVFNTHKIEAVIYFAVNSFVGESVENPLKYYGNNVYGTMTLLKVMAENNVDKIVLPLPTENLHKFPY